MKEEDRRAANAALLGKVDEVIGHALTDKELVPAARVPILKGTHVDSGIHVDISCSSPLGYHNTNLLKTYCEIDSRFQKLGFLVKKWAKLCGANDAREGTISSYAWLILVVHFLQTRPTPVLPFLQQLGEVKEKIVASRNVYFCDDISVVKKTWVHYGKNKESLGQLYYEFFRHYHNFSFEHLCPHTIHYPGVLPKDLEAPKFRSAIMAVRDPFDPDHNITGMVSRRGLKFVRYCMALRMRYLQQAALGSDAQKSFHSGTVLTDGVSPPPPFCPRCCQYEHPVFECPFPRNRRRGKGRDRGGQEARHDRSDRSDKSDRREGRGSSRNAPPSQRAAEDEAPRYVTYVPQYTPGEVPYSTPPEPVAGVFARQQKVTGPTKFHQFTLPSDFRKPPPEAAKVEEGTKIEARNDGKAEKDKRKTEEHGMFWSFYRGAAKELLKGASDEEVDEKLRALTKLKPISEWSPPWFTAQISS